MIKQFQAMFLFLSFASVPVVGLAASDAVDKIKTKQSLTQQIKIDINTADAREIAKALKGIGKKRAEAIVSWRNQHGPFKNIEEIAGVKGISKKVINANKKYIVVNDYSDKV